MRIDSGIASLVAALIALLSGLIGGYFAGKRTSALEYQKWWRGRTDDLAKEARLAAAELTRNLGAATHAMAWLTWPARNSPQQLTAKNVENYNEEMHKIFPVISGSLAVVSALSESVYREMEPLVEQIYKLDEQIALAGTRFIENPAGGAGLLGKYHEEVSSYSQSLNGRVADILQKKERTAVLKAEMEGPECFSFDAAPTKDHAVLLHRRRGRR